MGPGVHKVQIIVLLPHWVKWLKLERSFRVFCSFAQINPDLLYLDVNNFLITQWTFSLNVAHFLYQWFEKTVVTNYTFLLSIFMGIFLDVKRQGLDHYVSKKALVLLISFFSLFPPRVKISVLRRLDNRCTHSYPRTNFQSN